MSLELARFLEREERETKTNLQILMWCVNDSDIVLLVPLSHPHDNPPPQKQRSFEGQFSSSNANETTFSPNLGFEDRVRVGLTFYTISLDQLS